MPSARRLDSTQVRRVSWVSHFVLTWKGQAANLKPCLHGILFAISRELRRRISATIYGWESPLLTSNYPGFDCGSSTGKLSPHRIPCEPFSFGVSYSCAYKMPPVRELMEGCVLKPLQVPNWSACADFSRARLFTLVSRQGVPLECSLGPPVETLE